MIQVINITLPSTHVHGMLPNERGTQEPDKKQHDCNVETNDIDCMSIVAIDLYLILTHQK